MYKYQAVALKQVLIVYVAGTENIARPKKTLYFFPGLFFISFSYFGSFMVVPGLRSYIGFLGLGFSVDGV